MFFIRIFCIFVYSPHRYSIDGTWKCGRYFVKSDNARDNIRLLLKNKWNYVGLYLMCGLNAFIKSTCCITKHNRLISTAMET